MSNDKAKIKALIEKVGSPVLAMHDATQDAAALGVNHTDI
jgi:hypothetical protein